MASAAKSFTSLLLISSLSLAPCLKRCSPVSLRLHFHDCFVQGCDGSVLLDGSASGPSEQDAPPNLTLRAKAFEIIDDLRERIHKECGRVVSCSDILAIAALDSVYLSGGPDYDVPLGRRDGLNFATQNATLQNLPPPFANADTIL
ncbi:hypothetical protein OIU78_012473 [Salix suchowensis]|nr:hypothetical protein OIU78_012473 [Salix suchowensis]